MQYLNKPWYTALFWVTEWCPQRISTDSHSLTNRFSLANERSLSSPQTMLSFIFLCFLWSGLLLCFRSIHGLVDRIIGTDDDLFRCRTSSFGTKVEISERTCCCPSWDRLEVYDQRVDVGEPAPLLGPGLQLHLHDGPVTKPHSKECWGEQRETRDQGRLCAQWNRRAWPKHISSPGLCSLIGNSLSRYGLKGKATFFLAGLISGPPRSEYLGVQVLPQVIIRISSLRLQKVTSLAQAWEISGNQDTGNEKISRVGYALRLPQKSSSGTHGPWPPGSAPSLMLADPSAPLRTVKASFLFI